MNITRVSPEFATDLIKLVNDCKGIAYNAEVDYISKKTGQRTHFKYVTLDKIYAHIKCNENFAILEPIGTNDAGQSALQIILVHKSGEAITSDYYILRVPENAAKQDEGAAITYTKRYALGSFLGLCTEEDNDSSPNDGECNSNLSPNVSHRKLLIAALRARGVNINEYAQKHNLSPSTTEETYAKLLEELDGN